MLSRTDHGQITPRDWFPAGGSESGYMAPDPKDPNIIYVSGTYGTVTRFNRRTSLSQESPLARCRNLGRRSTSENIAIPGRRCCLSRRSTRRLSISARSM